jgi:putative ABC transport system permease protein
VLVGGIMLAGAVAASQLRRAREVALWKTLGLTRLQIVSMFAVEYGLVGAVSGLISAVSAFALSALFARYVLTLTDWPSVATCALGVLALCGLSVIAGLLASARALRVAPLEVLRDPG